MKGLAQSLMFSLIGFNLPFMIVAVLLSAFNTKIDVLSLYLSGSTIDQAWIIFITYFPVIQISGVFFGLLLSKVRRSRMANPEVLIQSKFFSQILTFVFFVVIVNVFLSEVILTGAQSRQDTRITKTTIIKQLTQEAESAEKKTDLATAKLLYSEILSIEPDLKTARTKYDSISHELKNAPVAETAPVPESGFVVATDVVEVLDKAQKFLDEKDYYSAHYYANLALKLNPKNKRGTEISETAWKAITVAAETAADKEKFDLYQRKKTAYAVLLQKDYTESYYLFQKLAAEAPDDKDIQRYLAESEEQLKSSGFFIEEAESYSNIPGTLNLLFINPAFKDGKEFISIQKCVYTTENIFAYDLEILRQDAGGKTIFHIKCPYAKIKGDNLIYYAISRGKEQKIIKPQVLSGTLPSNAAYLTRIGAPRTMIPYLIPREGRPDSASILSLWTLYGLIGEFGFNRNVYLLELIRRVGILFNFLFAMIISVALAMKFIESDKRKPSAASLVLTPVVLVSVAFAFSFLNFGYTAVSAYLVSTSNLLITTVVAISLQILLQFFGFFYLAGQKTLS